MDEDFRLELLARARELRREQSPAEDLLWRCLRGRYLNGLKFRRQHPVAGFVVDFYCAAVGLVIEVDGESHVERAVYDEGRTRVLELRGLRVIRFTNEEVRLNLEGVVCRISDVIQELGNPSP